MKITRVYNLKSLIILFVVLPLTACTGVPHKVQPVSNFELDKYLGEWHEIARLDHSFERGMNQVTATYSLRDDGGVKVVNRGYSEIEKQWSEAEGKAYFVDKNDEGYLKVSFFGPFYGSYVIFELEKENYQYAFISGPNLDYLWLLSRTPKVPESIIEKFFKMSKERGFNTSEIIIVDH